MTESEINVKMEAIVAELATIAVTLGIGVVAVLFLAVCAILLVMQVKRAIDWRPPWD